MRNIRPDIKTIVMSGCTKDIVDQNGTIESDITLLVKPINPNDPVKKSVMYWRKRIAPLDKRPVSRHKERETSRARP